MAQQDNENAELTEAQLARKKALEEANEKARKKAAEEKLKKELEAKQKNLATSYDDYKKAFIALARVLSVDLNSKQGSEDFITALIANGFDKEIPTDFPQRNILLEFEKNFPSHQRKSIFKYLFGYNAKDSGISDEVKNKIANNDIPMNNDAVVKKPNFLVRLIKKIIGKK